MLRKDNSKRIGMKKFQVSESAWGPGELYTHTQNIKIRSCIYLRKSVKYVINTVKEFLVIKTELHNIYHGNGKFMVTYCKAQFIVDFGFFSLKSSVT